MANGRNSRKRVTGKKGRLPKKPAGPKKRGIKRKAPKPIERMIEKVGKTYGSLKQHLDDLLFGFDQIGTSAIHKDRVSIISRLSPAFRDLQLLQNALASSSRESLPQTIRESAHAVESFFDCIKKELGLEPAYQLDQELSVPASKMADLDLEAGREINTSEILRVVITSPGWKLNGRIVVKPKFRLLN